VSEYPVLTVRIPPATKRQLEALSARRRVPQWQLVDEALRALLGALPAAERSTLARARSRPNLRQFPADEDAES
jgi:hypothetical protein